jgi:membrane-associated phospholipid phosphatase
MEKRPRGDLQLVLIVAAWLVYFGIRAVTQGTTAVAERHAHDMVHLEERLGVHWEDAVQRVALRHDLLVDAANWMYIWGHWPVIAVTAVWLWKRVPQQYVTLRNAMFLSGGIGMLLFLLLPVAPPRLADIGLVDSVTVRSHAYRALQPPSLTNEYAAFPSLHFGWDLLVGITIARAASHRLLRVVGALLPIAMALAVIATANHYILDVLGGGVIALSSLLVVELVSRRRVRPPASAPVAALELQPRTARTGVVAAHVAAEAGVQRGQRLDGRDRLVDRPGAADPLELPDVVVVEGEHDLHRLGRHRPRRLPGHQPKPVEQVVRLRRRQPVRRRRHVQP